MLSQANENIRQLFLKKFTAELILNYKNILKKSYEEKLNQESYLLSKQQKENEEREIRNKLKEIISKPVVKTGIQPPTIQQKIAQKPIIQQSRILQTPQLKVLKPITKTFPETPLPPEKKETEETENTFDSVKSAILPSGEINFGKIAQFIGDPTVSSLECRRSDEIIMIKKLGQTISTEVKLNENEINALIKAFSEKTRIPLIEGVLRAKSGDLEIFAVISKFSTSKFIITKNLSTQNTNMVRPISRQMIPTNPFANQKMPPLSLLKK
jgi:hypothetical protein